MQQEIRKATRTWIKPLVRTGYATKGVVYLLVGGLALLSAFGGADDRVAGKQEAVRSIGEQPFGEVLLMVAGFGLSAYTLFCLLRGLLNLDHKAGLGGLVKRGAALFSAVVYASLALASFQLALHEPAAHGGTRTWVARVMAEPFGPLLIGIAGAIVVGVGVLQLWRAVTTAFLDELDTPRLSRRACSVVTTIGRIGLTARGAVFCVIGYYLIMAARTFSPAQSRDFAGALRQIALQPHGKVGLACIAAGLTAYGLYTLVSARYARLGA